MNRHDPFQPATDLPSVLRPPAQSLAQQRAQLPPWSAGRATALGLDADVGATAHSPRVATPPAKSIAEQLAEAPPWTGDPTAWLGLDRTPAGSRAPRVPTPPPMPRVAPPPAMSIAEQLAQLPPWSADRAASLGMGDDGRFATAPRVVTPPRLSLAEQMAQLPSWRAGRAFGLGIGEPDPRAFGLSGGLSPVLQALGLLAQRAFAGGGANGSGVGSQVSPEFLLLQVLAGLFGQRR